MANKLTKLEKLLNEYGFTKVAQYHEMIAESFINGQRSQACTQYEALPRPERIDLLYHASMQDEDAFGADDIRLMFAWEKQLGVK